MTPQSRPSIERPPPPFPRWLVPAALATTLPALGKPPAVDEETYLAAGRDLDFSRPYDWAHALPPWDGDAFLFAHPPLHLWWMGLLRGLEGVPALSRLVAGAPWIALFAWATARLAQRLCHHPALAAATWLASTVTVLGLQDTWMIDLPYAALVTFAFAAWREAVDDPRWELPAGVAMGLACVTKYPALLFAAVLAAHMARRGWRWRVAAPMVGIFAGVEAWLAVVYGRLHVWEVWTRRGEIATGGGADRVVGTLVRLALGPLPLVLFRSKPAVATAGALVALGAMAWARPIAREASGVWLLVLCGVLGGAVLARATWAAASQPQRRRKGDRDDGLLLGGWVLAGIGGVAALHNYAATRYLLPVTAPVAILLARSAEEVQWGKAIQKVAVGLAAALAIVLAVADYRYVAAGAEVGEKTAAAVPEGGRFAGEWSFRWAMEKAGWTRYRPGEALPSGTWVAVVENASPGEVDTARMEPMRRVESDDHFPLRVVNADTGAGLYAETLGPLPFTWTGGPLEAVTLYKVR